MTRILGISAYYHDSAACLVEDGRIVAALQEERFTRQKHDSSFPSQAAAAALRIGACSIQDIDYVVFYEKPFLKMERLLDTYIRNYPRGLRSYLKAMPALFKEKMWVKDHIRKNLDFSGKVLFAEHHESHAASAFYPSPFQSAAILTVDGVGEWTTTALGRGRDHVIELHREIRFPHSLGLLYTAFTQYLGFEVNSGEYKVMGLAAYGKPVYEADIRKHLIQVGSNGAFELNPEYFNYQVGLEMTSPRFHRLFGDTPRQPGAPLTQKHRDLAASVQKVAEDLLLDMCRYLRKETGEANLCMAGGVALNCVANGRILRESGFEDVWVQPAAGDAGGALGAALAVWHGHLQKPRGAPCNGQQSSLLGTEYDGTEVRSYLDSRGARYDNCDEPVLLSRVAHLLSEGLVVGWFQGRMEFGPRALGARSILADPRRPDMKDRINADVKFRESFRPFAPAVLSDFAPAYFELDRPSPYMLLVAPVREEKRSALPAVTHVDGTARIQTVCPEGPGRLYELLRAFETQTGCPVLLNTSFNLRNEPIVESPGQAYECFMRSGLDALVIGDCLLEKSRQPVGLEEVTGT